MECTFSKWKFKKGSGPVPQQLAASPKGKNCKPHCPDPFLQHMSLASRPGNAVEFRSIARVNRDHLDAGFPECAKSKKKWRKKSQSRFLPEETVCWSGNIAQWCARYEITATNLEAAGIGFSWGFSSVSNMRLLQVFPKSSSAKMVCNFACWGTGAGIEAR